MASTRRAFVAHQRVDAAFVQTVAVHLLNLATGWILNDLIPYIDEWEPLAVKAIEDADAFVLVTTRGSVDSRPCRVEWEAALKLGKPIIRIDLDCCPGALVPETLRDAPAVVATTERAEIAAEALHNELTTLADGRGW